MSVFSLLSGSHPTNQSANTTRAGRSHQNRPSLAQYFQQQPFLHDNCRCVLKRPAVSSRPRVRCITGWRSGVKKSATNSPPLPPTSRSHSLTHSPLYPILRRRIPKSRASKRKKSSLAVMRPPLHIGNQKRGLSHQTHNAHNARQSAQSCTHKFASRNVKSIGCPGTVSCVYCGAGIP